MQLDKKKNLNRGKFIVFEGIDGSGKSTQVQLLAERIKSISGSCYITREPTDSPIGSVIHQIMTGRIKTDNRVIAALFAADRLDHLLNDTDGLLPMIRDGINVISDRYYFSSYAYHSVDMPMDWVIEANSESAKILRPDATIFIDVVPNVAIERISKNRQHSELFETLERLSEVRKKYFEAFQKEREKENILIINGNKSIQEISEEIWSKVAPIII